ncbi:hypothetical protein, partial [Liquorilactobacillus vini]|uniref:hypothetical protein n=1 Tax=Liquorilactobacillus vini TaxID=238015 RepID=UPI001F3DD3E3
GIKIIGPKLGRKPKYIDQKERRPPLPFQLIWGLWWPILKQFYAFFLGNFYLPSKLTLFI